MKASTFKASAFKNILLRTSIFTPEIPLSGANIHKTLPERWAKRFDGESLILPRDAVKVPQGIHIPFLGLKSKDGEWFFEVFSKRINFIWVKQNSDGDPDYSEYQDIAKDFLLEFFNIFKYTPVRFAFIVESVQHITPEEGETPGKLLARHFCREEFLDKPFNRPQSFEINSHKQYELIKDYLIVNSWVKSKNGILTANNEPVIILEQDINTLLEDASTRQFTMNDFIEFLDEASKEILLIRTYYYPN